MYCLVTGQRCVFWQKAALHFLLHEYGAPHVEVSQHEKHCDWVPKYEAFPVQLLAIGPPVHWNRSEGVQDPAAHCAAVHVPHLNSHVVTSQQLPQLCWYGQ
jgi:hypothetical protein